VVVVVVVLAGCGSTVSVESAGSVGAEGLGPASTGTPAGAFKASSPANGPGGPASSGSDAGSTGSPAGALSAALGGAGAAILAGGGSGVSVASGPIQLGIFYTSGLTALATAFGAGESGAALNPKAGSEAVISYINQHGGLAGHQISPVWASIDAFSSESFTAQDQAACATFTEDNHVFAVVASTTTHSDFVSCLAQHGTPLIAAYGGLTPSSDLTQDPLLVVDNAPSAERGAAAVGSGLIGEGWSQARWNAASSCVTATKPRIGIVFDGDEPFMHAIYSKILAPMFAQAGTPVTDTFFLNATGSPVDILAEYSQQMPNVVLKFATDCVDHVLMFLTNAVPGYTFTDDADEQGYTPRYGWDSTDLPYIVKSETSGVAQQFHGSLGVGWQPNNDVSESQFDATASAPGARCLAVFGAAGMPSTSQAASWTDLQICDSLLFVPAALAGITGPLTTAVLAQQIDNLGGGYSPSLSYRAYFSGTHRDGAVALRTFAFVDSCSCLRYTSGIQRF